MHSGPNLEGKNISSFVEESALMEVRAKNWAGRFRTSIVVQNDPPILLPIVT